MSLDLACGSFTLNTGTGDQTIDHSAQFAGAAKLIFLLWTHRTSAGASAGAVFGFGVGAVGGDSTIRQRATCWGSADNSNSSDCSGDADNGAIIAYRAGGAANRDVEVALSSVGSGSFTLNVSNAGPGLLVLYLVLGGDLSAAAAMSAQAPTSTGAESYSASGMSGLTGKLAWFFNCVAGSLEETSSGGTNISSTHGWAASASQEGHSSSRHVHNAAAADTYRRQRTDSCYGTPGTGTQLHEANFTSFDADGGITVDFTDIDATAFWFYWLVASGTFQVEIGSFTLNTSPGQQTITLADSGLTPRAIVFSSVNNTVSANLVAEGHRCLGWYDAVHDVAGAIWAGDTDTADPTVTDSATSTTKALVGYTPGTPTLDWDFDGVSAAAGEFVIDVTDAPAGAVQVLYCAFGSAAAGAAPPPARRTLLGVGR